MKGKLSHLRIFNSILHVKTPGALGNLELRIKEMVFVGYERGTKGFRCFDSTTHKIQPFKEFYVSGVDIGFEDPSERMEGGANIRGVLQDVPLNEETGQSQGLTLISNEVMPIYQSIQAL